MIGGYADFQKWVSIFGLVSDSGPIPPILIPPGNTFIPSVTIVQGLSNVTVITDTDGVTKVAKYFGNTLDENGIIECSIKFSITTNGSSVQRQFQIGNLPGSPAFTHAGQAQICGLPSIVKTPGTEGNTGSGWNGNLTAVPSAGLVLFAFETSEVSTQYFLDLTFKYQIKI